MMSKSILNGCAGRPRNQEMTETVLRAVLELVEEVGFDNVTIDRISERTGASRGSIYRRWANVSAIVMDAFMAEAGPLIPFERRENIVETFRSGMKNLVETMDGRFGKILRTLFGQAQTNSQLREAVWSSWLEKRRAIAHVYISEAVENGELRPDVDANVLIDALYGPIYYRFLIGYAPLSNEYIDTLIDYVFGDVVHENFKIPVKKLAAE